jgi:hypothetical protein
MIEEERHRFQPSEIDRPSIPHLASAQFSLSSEGFSPEGFLNTWLSKAFLYAGWLQDLLKKGKKWHRSQIIFRVLMLTRSGHSWTGLARLRLIYVNRLAIVGRPTLSVLTIYLAKLLGLYCVIVSLALSLNRKSTITTVNEWMRNPPLMMLTGVITLAMGLALVIGHNVWSGGALPVP